MRKFAQVPVAPTQAGGQYLNPGATRLPGTTNIPLSGTAAGGQSGDGSFNNPDYVIGLLNQIKNKNSQQLKQYLPVLEKIVNDIQDPSMKKVLSGVYFTIRDNSSVNSGQVNNSLMPQNVQQVVESAIGQLEIFNNALKSNGQNKSGEVNNTQTATASPSQVLFSPGAGGNGMSGMLPVKTIQKMLNSPLGNTRTSQIIKKKKKTRGNPFKVLMGKVGKLLDHGLNKNQVVKHVARLKFWNKETVEKAVDIVKDYNRKKYRKASKITMKRFITAEFDFENIKRKYETMSNAELLLRKGFLEAVVDGMELYYPADDAKKDLSAINGILKSREKF